jgi:excisionase family DNA binding protein
MEKPTLITILEAAQFCRVHRNTMYLWVKTGAIPARRIGPKTWRIDPKDLTKPKEQQELHQ